MPPSYGSSDSRDGASGDSDTDAEELVAGPMDIDDVEEKPTRRRRAQHDDASMLEMAEILLGLQVNPGPKSRRYRTVQLKVSSCFWNSSRSDHWLGGAASRRTHVFIDASSVCQHVVSSWPRKVMYQKNRPTKPPPRAVPA